MRAKHTIPYLCMLASLAACAGGDPTATIPAADIAGTYQLRTIDQGLLPFLMAAGDERRVEVIDGSITLDEDRTFEDKLIYAVTSAEGAVEPKEGVITGTFATGLGTLTFMPEFGGAYKVTLTGAGTLEQTLADHRMAYER